MFWSTQNVLICWSANTVIISYCRRQIEQVVEGISHSHLCFFVIFLIYLTTSSSTEIIELSRADPQQLSMLQTDWFEVSWSLVQTHPRPLTEQLRCVVCLFSLRFTSYFDSFTSLAGVCLTRYNEFLSCNKPNVWTVKSLFTGSGLFCLHAGGRDCISVGTNEVNGYYGATSNIQWP